ncbi:hypothetical protein IFR05_010243 [Cadophora sp. M221]|nr:hypothetical protein IFR05_010243 [Cadophora sp. M221]
MHKTKPLDTANIVNVSADSSSPFERPGEQRHRRGRILIWAGPIGGYGIMDPACPKYKGQPE